VNIVRTSDFQRSYAKLTKRMKNNVDRKIKALAENRAHPSLRTHRVKEAKAEDVWVCYVSIHKRLLYQYQQGAIYVWDVGGHRIIDRVHLRDFALREETP